MFTMRNRMLDHFNRDFFGEDMFTNIEREFGRGFGNFGSLNDDFDRIANFDNFGDGQGQMICHSYSQST